MTERIKAGDLVMVWRGCPYCNSILKLGRTFVVAWIDEMPGVMRCCGRASVERTALEKSGAHSGWPAYVLKKINPTSENENFETREEITA